MRLVRHALNFPVTGNNYILVYTVDTDVLILLCGYSVYWLGDTSIIICLY